MLTVHLEDFMMQLKSGALHHIGPSTTSATVKLYDVQTTEARAFGDERIKFVFEDDAENVLEVALFPREVDALLSDVEDVRASGDVDGFDAR